MRLYSILIRINGDNEKMLKYFVELVKRYQELHPHSDFTVLRELIMEKLNKSPNRPVKKRNKN
jgi:hypothetical protein